MTAWCRCSAWIHSLSQAAYLAQTSSQVLSAASASGSFDRSTGLLPHTRASMLDLCTLTCTGCLRAMTAISLAVPGHHFSLCAGSIR